MTALTDQDRWLFGAGEHERLFQVMGAHPRETGTTFRVWAPNARRVTVVGDFNQWDPGQHDLYGSDAGIWEGTVSSAEIGQRYKYRIFSHHHPAPIEKSDPYAFHTEAPPATASVIWDTRGYEWEDQNWMENRYEFNRIDAPISIYEVHLGSFSSHGPDSYQAMADEMIEHCQRTGFTHVEFMPVMEYPFGGSWGYQTTGYFAPTARFGTPQDFMALVDRFHQAGIGVILDWVPSHFATDAHSLGHFDGTHLYEHADPRQGFHPDWKSFIFNYGRGEVRSFLLSSAHWWLETFHADGLRVDGVASMLYLDYSREEGDWVPNRYGGRENLEAIEFLRRLHLGVYRQFPDIQMVAEESTAWDKVTGPTDLGGLGFGLKWDMGWMNDTLRYFSHDPVHRSFPDRHRLLTFRGLYAHSENFVLALSHDEVVHGKGSLLGRQPGDEWQRFAGLRTLFGYQWGLPGKKLLFMGGEIADPWEWDHNGELSWEMLKYPFHQGVLDCVTDLNRIYRDTPALHRQDNHPDGFRWVVADDTSNSVLSFLRYAPGSPSVLVVANFTPIPRPDYRLGVPASSGWSLLLSTDSTKYGGAGMEPAHLVTDDQASHDFLASVVCSIPPMSVTFMLEDWEDSEDSEI